MTVSIGAMLRREIEPSHLAEAAHALDGVYDELWIVEDLPFAGGIAQLTSVLGATEHARIGHGIAPAPFRNPVALAMEWATLAEMYPGRLIAGVGHGVQEWMTQIGESVASPLTLLEETLVTTRGLLEGEEVTLDGRYVSVDRVKLEFPPRIMPPLMAGVTGPRSLRLAGAHADGTILPEGLGPEEIATARFRIDQGRDAGGRTDRHHLTVFAAFFADSGDLPELPEGVASSWLAVGADVDEVVSKLIDLIDTGIDSLILVPMGGSPQYQLDMAASRILPTLREHAAVR
ncbi:MAG: LLM class flavin-dependent oxidoreductase [Acidimicrobiia bacterium]|nr:LLM class flavin-dependent oxidoreductase [Acidimicrobiia bacterium]MDH5520780.1 LLM class flavin-dependent oxidoreductase [Acidimicrobiia bacterium]